jgi:PTS system ascorbate-specific IIA component
VLAQAFGPNSIAHHIEVTDWEGAISIAVALLEADCRVTSDYLAEVLASNQRLGPYFVVAPGIAIAHAAPGPSVLETGMALLRLEEAVFSGSNNDPVQLVFAFCAVDSDSHVELLASFAQVMSAEGNMNRLLNEPDLTIIRNLLTT